MGTKKSNKKEVYSHPLLKAVGAPQPESHTNVTPTYQPILPCHDQRPSSKLMRWSTLRPHPSFDLSLCLTPFHPCVQELPFLSQDGRCGHCGCAPLPNPGSENASRHCPICNLPSNNPIEVQTHAHQVILEEEEQKSKTRKMLLLIQASQQVFQSGLHTSLFQCIESLQSAQEDLHIGIAFYNNKYLTIVDLQSQTLVKTSPLQQWGSFPVPDDAMFARLSQLDNKFVQEVVNTVMYEAYFIKQSIIIETLTLIKQCCSAEMQLTVIGSTLTSSLPAPEPISKSILNQTQNLIPKLIQSTLSKGKKTDEPVAVTHPPLPTRPNFHFFILAEHITYQQAVDSLGFNLQRIYSSKDKSFLSRTFYYDMYEHLTTQYYYDTEMTITCSADLFINTKNNSNLVHSLNNNVDVTLSQGTICYNRYTVKIRQANARTMIPLEFKYSFKQFDPYLQVCYHRNSSYVVINSGVIKPSPQNSIRMELVDDEVLFNLHFRRALAKWKGKSFLQLRKLIKEEGAQLVNMARDFSGSQSINFPLSLKHYFLYVAQLDNQLSRSLLNVYSLFRLAHDNLENFGKKMYPRAYQVGKKASMVNNVKPMKDLSNQQGIFFVENGRQLLMVIHDPPVDLIRSVFGYYDTATTLGRQFCELPDLETNQEWQQLVSVIRAHHDSNYLPLRIIDSESTAFDCRVQPYLYDQSVHFNYLKGIWKGY